MFFRTRPFCLILLCLLPASAWAARPMITDDARLVDAQSCQVESWVKENPNSTEYWALPACNLGGNFELTLGGALGKDASGTQTTDVQIQGKTLFKPLETNGWGWGLTVGNVQHPAIQTDSNLLGDVYAFLPFSFSFRDDRFVLHTNLGGLHEKALNRTRGTWGLGSETLLFGQTWLIAESFGQVGLKPYYQFGIRQWLIPNRLQIDATYGNRMQQGDDSRWFSIGLRWLSDAILP